MSGLRTIKLTLDVGSLTAIDGCANDLTFKVIAHRKTKAGTHERYELELKACRYSVKQMLDGIKLMHARDRERINSELARIQREINALQVQS